MGRGSEFPHDLVCRHCYNGRTVKKLVCISVSLWLAFVAQGMDSKCADATKNLHGVSKRLRPWTDSLEAPFFFPVRIQRQLKQLQALDPDGLEYNQMLERLIQEYLGQSEVPYETRQRLWALYKDAQAHSPYWKDKGQYQHRFRMSRAFRGVAPFKIAAFAKLPAGTRDILASEYTESVREQVFDETRGHIPGVRMSEKLGQWYDAGENHARGLVSLGWEVRQVDGKTHLVPPQTLDVIFDRYEKEMDRLGIAEEDRIRPTLAFSNGVDWVYIRPGIDPLPPFGWRLHTNPGQVPHEEFYELVAQGKMPFGTSGFFLHDLGHLTDLLSNPEQMKQWKAYGREITRLGKEGKSPTLKTQWRSAILSEFFSLPDLSRKAEIQAALPHYFSTTPPSSIEDAKTRLVAQTEGDLVRHADRLLRLTDKGLLRLGGAMRDGYVEQWHNNECHRLTRILEMARKGSQVIALPKEESAVLDVPYALSETLLSLRDDIRMLSQMREDLDGFSRRSDLFQHGKISSSMYVTAPELNREGLKKLKEMPLVERNAKLRVLLLDRIARLEMALYTAVKLDITPEKVMREARNQIPSETSDTGRYFRSYVHPDSLSAQAFGVAP